MTGHQAIISQVRNITQIHFDDTRKKPTCKRKKKAAAEAITMKTPRPKKT